MKENEPLLKEEKETLILSMDKEEPEENFNQLPELKTENKPVTVDLAALMPEEEKVEVAQPNLEVSPQEEKNDIEIVEKPVENVASNQDTIKEPKTKEDIFAKYNVSKASVCISLVLTLIVVYLFAQAVYNFYVGFKYRDVDENMISEINE